jgi:hypothetical protein
VLSHGWAAIILFVTSLWPLDEDFGRSEDPVNLVFVSARSDAVWRECGSGLHGHRDFVISCGNAGIFMVQIGSRTGCVDRRVIIIGG